MQEQARCSPTPSRGGEGLTGLMLTLALACIDRFLEGITPTARRTNVECFAEVERDPEVWCRGLLAGISGYFFFAPSS